MEKWYFDDKSERYTACYYGNNKQDVIMKVWFERGNLHIENSTNCDDIVIPKEVINKLFGKDWFKSL